MGVASKRAALSLGEGTELARAAVDRLAAETDTLRQSAVAVERQLDAAATADLGRAPNPCSWIGRFVDDVARSCGFRVGVKSVGDGSDWHGSSVIE